MSARIDRIERMVSQLERAVQSLGGRVARTASRPALRLARVTADGSSSSSAAAEDCTVAVWKIRFLNAEFEQAEGQQDLDTTQRSETIHYAAADPERPIDIDSIVLVTRTDDHRWWIVESLGECAPPEEPSSSEDSSAPSSETSSSPASSPSASPESSPGSSDGSSSDDSSDDSSSDDGDGSRDSSSPSSSPSSGSSSPSSGSSGGSDDDGSGDSSGSSSPSSSSPSGSSQSPSSRSSSSGSSSSDSSDSSTTGECSECTDGAAAEYTTSFSGVTNNTCAGCPDFNTTFVLSHAVTCIWNWVGPEGETCWPYQVDLYYSSGTWYLEPSIKRPGEAAEVVATYKCTPANFNCLGTSTFNLDSSNGRCANWPASVTVSPN